MSRIVKHSAAPFTNRYGTFTLHAFEFDSGREDAALVVGDPRADDRPLVRVQSSCLTGTTFGAQFCDCGRQFELALLRIATEGSGIVLYLDQEGAGHGLVGKVDQFAQLSRGEDVVGSLLSRGEPLDLRDYPEVKAILDQLIGGGPIRLMTNNPAKAEGLIAAGVDVAEEVPIEAEPTDDNREYLRMKKALMGHRLTNV